MVHGSIQANVILKMKMGRGPGAETLIGPKFPVSKRFIVSHGIIYFPYFAKYAFLSRYVCNLGQHANTACSRDGSGRSYGSAREVYLGGFNSWTDQIVCTHVAKNFQFVEEYLFSLES